MNHKFRYLALYLTIISTILYGSISDFEKIHKDGQREFVKKMKVQIKQSISSKSKRVKEAYKAISYQPVWIDSDYLTQYSELLYDELKDDFDKGLDKDLVVLYEKLQPSKNHKFESSSIKDKVKLEIGIMQLYLSHIDDMLKGKHSRYNAITLLQYALKEHSLISAINKISKERIQYRTQQADTNGSTVDNSMSMAIKLTDGDEKVRLNAMYKLLNYRPIWISKSALSKYSKELFEQIANDPTLSHDTSIYNQYRILKNLHPIADHKEIIHYELKIAKLYQRYMSHLLYGSIDWKRFQRDLKRNRPNGAWIVHNILSSPESLLIESIKAQTLKYAFKEAKPLFPLYDRMLRSLIKYQKIVDNGGWGKLPDFGDLKPNMQSSIVTKLVDRLKIEGDYNSTAIRKQPNLYDRPLLDAVVRFQKRHGLIAQGYIGKMTKEALDESAEEKVSKIKLNLDRIKWVKREDDKYHIYVNIPAFQMYLFDGLKIMESMEVIVGKRDHETPIFYGKVRTIVLNPYWRIPNSIIRDDLIPKLQKNPDYTNSKNIEIHTGYSEYSPLVDPHSIDWDKYTKSTPPYKFMQEPGKFNALGKIKYLFPNPYSVYMHDTNEKYLFDKQKRALSHGCIRLHKPFKLLKSLSTIDDKVDYQKAKMILKENRKTPLRLSNSIPIDTVYLTTWVDTDGTIEFRNDIYGYDEMQLSTLKR